MDASGRGTMSVESVTGNPASAGTATSLVRERGRPAQGSEGPGGSHTLRAPPPLVPRRSRRLI
eukprot:10898485-Alexandrium_andersonii.AAC.1